MTAWWALAPIAAQAAAMAVDEGWFHRRRGLARWERIGHPLDALTVLACYGFALAAPFARGTLAVFVALALFSSVFVTKDEPIHARACGVAEHWLHAVLFVLHPLVLGAVGALWAASRGALPALGEPAAARTVLAAGALATLGFGAWQALYWNVFQRRARA